MIDKINFREKAITVPGIRDEFFPDWILDAGFEIHISNSLLGNSFWFKILKLFFHLSSFLLLFDPGQKKNRFQDSGSG